MVATDVRHNDNRCMSCHLTTQNLVVSTSSASSPLVRFFMHCADSDSGRICVCVYCLYDPMLYTIKIEHAFSKYRLTYQQILTCIRRDQQVPRRCPKRSCQRSNLSCASPPLSSMASSRIPLFISYETCIEMVQSAHNLADVSITDDPDDIIHQIARTKDSKWKDDIRLKEAFKLMSALTRGEDVRDDDHIGEFDFNFSDGRSDDTGMETVYKTEITSTSDDNVIDLSDDHNSYNRFDNALMASYLYMHTGSHHDMVII